MKIQQVPALFIEPVNLNADFKNKSLLIKLLNDINEKNEKKIHIINENNKTYLQFNNSTMFLGIKDNKLFLENEKKYSWVFEKYDNQDKYIQMERFELNKKFYYKNINTNQIITNFYSLNLISGTIPPQAM